MKLSSKILIALLVVSYIAMGAYMSYQYPEQTNFLLHSVFGLVLIGTAIIGIIISGKGSKSKGIGRAFKVLFASFALAFAIWMGSSILIMPVLGFRGFELMGSGWFGVTLLAGAALASPFVAKRLS